MKVLFFTAPVLALTLNTLSDGQPTCIAQEFEHGIDYKIGPQYGVGEVNATDEGDCCTQCTQTDQCQFFTYVTTSGECWLKPETIHHGKPTNSYRKGCKTCISGSIYATTTTTTTTTVAPPTPPPTPLAPPTPAPPVTGPVQVYVMMGQSNMLGEGKIDGWKDGTLETAVVTKGLYPYLLDGDHWAQVDHIRDVAVMGNGGLDGTVGTVHHNEWLSVNPSKKKTIGPELGIGFTMANATKAPVMLLKSCIGNRALGWDLLPPSSKEFEFTQGNKTYVYAGYGESPMRWEKGQKPEPKSWYAGIQYDGDINRTKLVLEDLAKFYPGATKHEVAGFFWWQGDRDSRDAGLAGHYEINLVQLIKQLRKEFNAPNAKFVTASLGQTAKGSTGGDGKILDAMLAVDGKSGKYPEFAGNVAAVYTHPLSKGGSSGSHYGGNSETYMNVGEAMGAAMNELNKAGSVSYV